MLRDRKHRQVALFAAIALALQSLLTLDVLAAIAVENGAIRIVTICTGDGFEQIALDAQNQPVPAQHNHEDCPECVLATATTCGLPANSVDTLTLAPSGLAVAFRTVLPATGRTTFVPRSRAPPEDQRL
jgi:hypothetical protein